MAFVMLSTPRGEHVHINGQMVTAVVGEGDRTRVFVVGSEKPFDVQGTADAVLRALGGSR